jgi:hypothetical protein
MSKFIGRLLVVLAFGWAGSVSSQVPITGDDIVIVDGRDWAQVDLFTYLTWNGINAVCPGGVCTGELNGYDVTGWAWATVADVNDLFNTYLGEGVMGGWPDNQLSEAWDGPWGGLLFNVSFRQTSYPSSSGQSIEAFTRTDAGPRDVYKTIWLDSLEESGGSGLNHKAGDDSEVVPYQLRAEHSPTVFIRV